MLSLQASEEVFAHGAFQGIGTFYGGVLHPWVVPAHLLALIATGLYVGQRGWGDVVRTLPIFIAACAVGLGLAHPGVEAIARIALLTGAAVIGVLVAADLRVPPGVGILLLTAIGFIVAVDSAPEAQAGAGRFAALAGTCIGVSAVFVWISGPVTCLVRPWQRIGVRVAGSWISACALLVLALAVSGKLPAGA